MWVSREKNLVHVPSNQVKLFLDAVDTCMISLKGSNVFPVTYAVIAQVCAYESFFVLSFFFKRCGRLCKCMVSSKLQRIYFVTF